MIAYRLAIAALTLGFVLQASSGALASSSRERFVHLLIAAPAATVDAAVPSR